eukprot:1159338-Pelagomonas_calceolata.AAC.8
MANGKHRALVERVARKQQRSGGLKVVLSAVTLGKHRALVERVARMQQRSGGLKKVLSAVTLG